MFFYLLFLFTLIPLAELWLLIWFGSVTSPTTAILLVVFTGVVGASLAKWQGLETWKKIQLELAQGKPPAGSLVDGLLILIAGALLITPGLMTDCVGFSLLLPFVRTQIKRVLQASLKRQAEVRMQSFYSQFQPGPAESAPIEPGTVVDVEFTRKPDPSESGT